MDLLFNAYSNSSDEEPEKLSETRPQFQIPVTRKPKRPRPGYTYQAATHRSYNDSSCFQREAPLPGRYVSKRERALSGSITEPKIPEPDPEPNRKPSPLILGSISDSNLPKDVYSALRHQVKGHGNQSILPGGLPLILDGHTKPVNAIHWSTTHAHLLASAGLDNMVTIWNVWSRDQKKARVFSYHIAPVKDVKWSWHRPTVLSCGYDCSSRLVDVEKGLEIHKFEEDQVVGVIKFHPQNSNLFLSGGSKGRLKLWDTRTNKAVHEYIRELGSILDVEFSTDGKSFISSSDVSSTNKSENSILVWDIAREIPLSNQVYAEAFTCPSIKYHPFDPCFVAQSNGNYIAIFDSRPPFKLNKYKRYEGHGVSGFAVKCDFSLDGEQLVSASSDGSVYLYNYRSSDLIRKIKVCDQACLDVDFHPIIPNVIATSSWNGDITVLGVGLVT